MARPEDPRQDDPGRAGWPGRLLNAPRAGAAPDLPQVRLLGLPLHAVTEEQGIGHILSELDAGRGGWAVTPNLDYARRLLQDPVFAALYRGAELKLADGMPLVWASRLQGTPLPERVAGSDLVVSLSRAAARARRSVFFLGGDEGTAEKAARVLAEGDPALVVAGTACPARGFERDPDALAQLAEQLAHAHPDIVLVALGSPKQDWVIHRLRAVLPGAWWLGVGISFSFVSGDVRRAPRWIQHSGLEWAHRLGQEPRRLARRYLIDGLPFAASFLTRAWLARRTDAPR